MLGWGRSANSFQEEENQSYKSTKLLSVSHNVFFRSKDTYGPKARRRTTCQHLKEYSVYSGSYNDGTTGFEGTETVQCPRALDCRLPFCGIPRTRYVYGLYDHRTRDIFSVGSAFDVSRRFQEHLRNNAYAQDMIERGLVPILLPLLACTTLCDQYSRWAERSIALQLRAQGHSAYSDDTRYAYTIDHWFYHMVEEQAHQVACLRAMFEQGASSVPRVPKGEG